MVFIRILSLSSSLLSSSEGCFVNMVSSKSLNKRTESLPLLRDNATYAENGVTGNFLVVPILIKMCSGPKLTESGIKLFIARYIVKPLSKL